MRWSGPWRGSLCMRSSSGWISLGAHRTQRLKEERSGKRGRPRTFRPLLIQQLECDRRIQMLLHPPPRAGVPPLPAVEGVPPVVFVGGEVDALIRGGGEGEGGCARTDCSVKCGEEKKVRKERGNRANKKRRRRTVRDPVGVSPDDSAEVGIGRVEGVLLVSEEKSRKSGRAARTAERDVP